MGGLERGPPILRGAPGDARPRDPRRRGAAAGGAGRFRRRAAWRRRERRPGDADLAPEVRARPGAHAGGLALPVRGLFQAPAPGLDARRRAAGPSGARPVTCARRRGPSPDVFHRLAASSWLPTIDHAVSIGLVLVGLSLVLGLFTQAGCVGAMLLLAMFYVSSIPTHGVHAPGNEGAYLFVNKNLVEAAAVLAVFAFRTGRIAGLDLLASGRGPRAAARRGGRLNLTPEQEALGRRNFLKALAGTPALAALGAAAATRGPVRGGPVKVALDRHGRTGPRAAAADGSRLHRSARAVRHQPDLAGQGGRGAGQEEPAAGQALRRLEGHAGQGGPRGRRDRDAAVDARGHRRSAAWKRANTSSARR